MRCMTTGAGREWSILDDLLDQFTTNGVSPIVETPKDNMDII